MPRFNMKGEVVDFLEGKYRSPFCHECREDTERCKRAMELDGKIERRVQIVKCRSCGKRLRWWWFSKLPLTDDEKQKLAEKKPKPGVAW